MIEPKSLSQIRRQFHDALLGSALTVTEDGIVSIADKKNRSSREISAAILNALGGVGPSAKQKGQSSGVNFEGAVESFLRASLLTIPHLFSGRVEIARGANLSAFQQFRHLAEIDRLVRDNHQLKSALGSDYLIKPDVYAVRLPETDEHLNSVAEVVTASTAMHASLRAKYNPEPILKAVISCKWTLRSDRAQNARTEALNLIKNRKGAVPRILVVTAEPMPSRLSSLAFGTGEIDMVYHFALRELKEAVESVGDETAKDILNLMIEGNRLKDISDLPLDIVA